MDLVRLERFVVPCVIGLQEEEQGREQPLEIEVALGLDLEAAGDAADLSASVDYAAVCDEVTFLARAGHWRLLETLALVVLRHLLAPPAPGEARAAVHSAGVVLRKPEILGGRAVPGIRMERDASWRAVTTLLAEGIEAEVLAEVAETGAYRVLLAPDARWEVAAPVVVHVVSGAVRIGGEVHGPGAALRWGAEALVAETPSVLLAVARPPLR